MNKLKKFGIFVWLMWISIVFVGCSNGTNKKVEAVKHESGTPIDGVLDVVESDADTVEWDGLLTAPINVDLISIEYTDADFTAFESPPYSEAIVEFLELYKGYETQCWNDSTFGYWEGDDYPYKDLWFHKEPTFKGFMQYLRKK